MHRIRGSGTAVNSNPQPFPAGAVSLKWPCTRGAIFAPKGRVASALKFTFERGAIVRVDIFRAPATVRALEIAAI